MSTDRFQQALDVQDACNPSGVARLFIRELDAFNASPEYTGTDSIRRDPALRLIAYKLCELMGICASLEPAYDAAFAECEARAGVGLSQYRDATASKESDNA